MRWSLLHRVEVGVPLIVAVLSRPTFAQGWIVPRPCGIGIIPVEGRPAVAPPIRDCRQNIARTRSDVRVELADRVLRYEVEERFVNRGGVVGEADYLFPLPANAAFQDLKLSINGELVSGETMNASQARGIYEAIVRAQRDPALVEWMGHGLLRARIFPINPGEEKRIVVRFQSVASREGDALRIDYFRGGAPGTTNVRDDGSNSFTLTYRATPELGTPYSPTHQLDFHNSTNRTEVAVRGDAKDVTLLVPARRAATAAISTLAYAPGNEDGFALITVTPPATQRDDAIPRDITLVLDVSGSMSGRKMEQARAAGRQLLATLRPADRFRLIDFSSDVRTFQNEFVSATDANVRQAMRYLDALDASGGTNIEGALREAMRPAIADGRLPIILFLTDGEPTIGERQPDRLASIATDANARSRDTRRIFTFGLGSDVNVSLLETLALEGRGTSQFVRPDESVERTVGIVADRLVGPVLTDVRIHVEGDPRLSKMLPSQPSDLFADHDLVALTRYTGHGQARVVVEGNRRGTPVRWTSTVDLPDRERDNQFVARLWAAQRVGYLSAEKRKHGASQEIDDEIRMLGERYGIPTEFTSYLVTEPQLVANRRGILTPTNAGGAAPPAADQRFEMAKAAAAQRAVGNIASLDSIKAAAPVAGGMARGDVGASPKRIDARTFTLRDSVWTDVRFRAGMETIIIKPYSKGYFDLLTQLPELRSVFALGDRVIVVGKSVAISLDAAKGASEISASMRATIARAW